MFACEQKETDNIKLFFNLLGRFVACCRLCSASKVRSLGGVRCQRLHHTVPYQTEAKPLCNHVTCN